MQGDAAALPLPVSQRELLAAATSIEFSTVGKFERLPKWLNCIPLVVQWLWLSLRYGSVSLPSAANPYITCGGMVGEGKREYFDCMGAFAKSYVAANVSLVVTGEHVLQEALSGLRQRNIQFPIVAKPDLGWCGYGVRKIDDETQLAIYLKNFPEGYSVMLQTYLPEVEEAGIFYVRHPEEPTGAVLGILLRNYPRVTGNGVHNVAQLIAGDSRLRRIMNNSLHDPAYDPSYIPVPGEEVRLALIGSTRIGGLYCDGSEYITSGLTSVIDAIAKDMPEFYVGRFDVRYENPGQLSQGKFTIMEVNGAGSEAVHAWDPKYSIYEAYRIIFAKQRLLFRIGAINRRRGYRPIGLFKLAQLHVTQQRLIKRYPLSN